MERTKIERTPNVVDDYFGPAPRRQGWTDLRIIGEPADVEALAALIYKRGEVWTDSGNKPVNSQPGIDRRYIRAQLLEVPDGQ